MKTEDKNTKKEKMLSQIKQIKADILKIEQTKEAQREEELNNLKIVYEKFTKYYQDFFGEKVPAL